MPEYHGRYRYRTGRRSGYGPLAGLRPVRLTVAVVILMAALAVTYALVRKTTAHDWYAAGMLVTADILTDAGFDRRAPIRYRTGDGRVILTTRSRIRYSPEAIVARNLIVRTAAVAMEAGAVCGLASSLFWLLFLRPGVERREWDDAPMGGPVHSRAVQIRQAPPLSGPDCPAAPPVAVVEVEPVETMDQEPGMAPGNTPAVREPTHPEKPENTRGNWF